MEDINIICENIRSTIINVALREDAILKIAGKGIFFMPELAFAYEVGKQIYLTRKSVLLDEGFEWKREEKVGDGIADLIFVHNNKVDRIVIEFKVMSKDHQYKKDIVKLKGLPESNLKLFCALEDIFVKNIHEKESRRIFRISKDFKELESVNDPFTFSTASNYQQPVVCSVELWRVK